MDAQNRNVYLSIMVALLFIIGAAAFIFYYKGNVFVSHSPSPSSLPSPIGSPQPFVATLGGEQFNLTRKGDLAIPAIRSSKPALKADLPEIIQNLILYESRAVTIIAATYDNGQTGWKITSTVEQDLRTTFASHTNLLAPSRGWTEQLFGGHGTYFGIYEVRNKEYAVRLSLIQRDTAAQKSEITFEIIKL